MTSLRTSAAVGVFWSALQMWFARASSAAAFIVLGRQLEPVDFGLIALAAAVVSVLSTLADSGLATYLVRAEKITPRVLSTAFWTSCALSIGLAALLLATTTPIAAAYDEPGLVPVLRWLSLSLFLTGLGSVPTALLRRDLRFKQLAVRGSVAVAISSVVAVLLALAGAGVWALVVQTLLNGAVSTVIVWLAARWRPTLEWEPRLAGSMLRFGSQLLGIDLLSQARSRGQDFMIAAFAGPVGLGMWSVASRLLTIILDTGTSVVNAVATPVFAKMQADKDRLFRAYEMSLATASAVVLPLMFVMGVVSPVLVPAVLGQQWESVSTVAQILAFSAAISSLSYFDRSIFVALDRLRVELVLVVISVVTQLAVVAAVTRHGLTALAVALLARNAVVVAVRVVTIHRSVGLPYARVVPALRVLVAAAWTAGAVEGATRLIDPSGDWWYLALAAVVAVVVYPLALLAVARPIVTVLRMEVQRVRRGRRSAPTAPPAQPVVLPGATPVDDVPLIPGSADGVRPVDHDRMGRR